MSRLVPFTVVVALLAGCGSRTGGGAADLAGAANADLSATADDLAGAATGDMTSISPCNNLTLAGTPTVAVNYVAMGAPTFTGGTIADGTYFITSGAFYTGAGGMTGSYGSFRGVYRFSGTTVDLLVSTPQGIESETATIATSTKNLTLSPTCGGQPSQEVYTATTTSLSLGMITGSLGTALTLTKQ
jgi:hypothetical protein